MMTNMNNTAASTTETPDFGINSIMSEAQRVATEEFPMLEKVESLNKKVSTMSKVGWLVTTAIAVGVGIMTNNICDSKKKAIAADAGAYVTGNAIICAVTNHVYKKESAKISSELIDSLYNTEEK